MLNRIILSTISLTTLTVVVTWPVAAVGRIHPLSPPSQASIQFSNGQFNNGQFMNNGQFSHDPFTEQPSDDLSGLMITGCSQLGSGGPQVCLQWLGDALTTCLEWGEDAIVTACMQKGDSPEEELEESYTTSSTRQDPSGNDWGFSVELTLQ